MLTDKKGCDIIRLKGGDNLFLHPDYKKNQNFDPNLCDMMIAYRARHNITQRELAKRLGVSLATVVNVETGRRGPSKTTRIKILDEIAKG